MSLASVDAMTTIGDETLREFADGFRGRLLRPGDDGYDIARRVWNGMIDKRPALIARCSNTADVVAAVRFAASRDLRVAVRGGGHNVAGNAVCDGGIVIDLSLMKGIQVDPQRRIARAQGGVTWGELDRETQLLGLATPGGEVSTTGIAGYTLSGGLGMLHRKHGLACDNLLAAEVVSADGSVLQASMTDHPDLFWAIRGGGGNFGIVTWFEYQLYPLGPEVYSVAAIYPGSQAGTILRRWRDYTSHAPDEVTSEVLLWGMPAIPDLSDDMHGMPVVVVCGLLAGPAGDGEAAFGWVRELGEPLADFSGVGSYVESQCAFDWIFEPGIRCYWKSLFLDTLNDELIDAIVAVNEDRPSAQTALAIRHLGGAISRMPEAATAYGNRNAAFNLSLDAIWDDQADDERMIAWTRHAWTDMRERTGGGVYLNFAGLGEENDMLARAGYGRNYDRLREVKRRYDPMNLFQGNINVTPKPLAT